jgi:hypothetical protein
VPGSGAGITSGDAGAERAEVPQGTDQRAREGRFSTSAISWRAVLWVIVEMQRFRAPFAIHQVQPVLPFSLLIGGRRLHRVHGRGQLGRGPRASMALGPRAQAVSLESSGPLGWERRERVLRVYRLAR